MDPTERRPTDHTREHPSDAECGWSRFAAFPIMVAAIVGLLWRRRSAVPAVPHPRVLKDARLR